MQTVTVEYIVNGPLDGVTPAPAVVVQPNAAGDRPDVDDQIYRKEVDALGIIDPSLIGGLTGSFGPRLVAFIWIDGAEPGESGASIDIVGVRRDGTVAQQQEVASLQGLSTIYLPVGAVVPQGSALRMRGVPEGASPTTVRVTLLVPETFADIARIIEVITINIEGDQFAFSARTWGVPTDGSDAAPSINALLAAASTASTLTGRNQRVLLPTGTYTYSTDIEIPANVDVWGEGPSTILLQRDGAEVRFVTGFLRSHLQDVQIRGESQAAPVGRGVVLTTSQMCSLKNVQIWFFQTGIALSDGSAYSAHHQIGPNVEVNACRTGILCGPNGNSNTIQTVRVFYAFAPDGSGIALDIDSSTGLRVSNLTSDSADTCLRLRNNGPTPLRLSWDGGFLEPGTNPDTGAGVAYDIDVPNADGSEPVVSITGVYPSALGGVARLDPEGYHSFDMWSRFPYGGRFSGSGNPKRNFVRNGMFNYFNASIVPGLTSTVAPVPTFAQVQTPGDFLTGVRAIRFTATGNGSRGMVFQAADNGSRWITCGVRYRVPAGNPNFSFSATIQGASRQYVDAEETPAGEWREGWVTLPLDPSNASRTGVIGITPGTVAGNQVLIDEIWAVEGRYSVASTGYGERIEMLQAPIPIYDQTFTSNQAFTAPDITTLPATLGSPLADFSAAPYGVVGAVYRFTVTTDSGVFGTALANRHSLVPSTPGAAPVIAAANTWVPDPQFSQVPMNTQMAIRSTALACVTSVGDGLSTRFQIAVVAWILQ